LGQTVKAKGDSWTNEIFEGRDDASNENPTRGEGRQPEEVAQKTSRHRDKEKPKNPSHMKKRSDQGGPSGKTKYRLHKTVQKKPPF